MASETRAADTGSTGRGSRSPDRVTVGRDVLVGGRLARLLYAAAAVWYRVDKDLRLDNGYVLSTVLWFLVVCAGYLALYRLVLVRVLDRVNPWTGAALFVVPSLLYPLEVGSDAFHDGLGLYMLLGFVLTPLMGYGGMSLAALPALVTGRRHRLYDPFNVLDLAELGLRSVPRSGRRLGWLLAVAVTVGYVVVCWVVTLLSFVEPVRDLAGRFTVPAWCALAALVPAGYLAWRAVTVRRATGGATGPSGAGDWRAPAWGALALLTCVPVGTAVPDTYWGLIILLAVVTEAVGAVRRRSAGRR